MTQMLAVVEDVSYRAPYGLIEFVRRARGNQLALYPPEMFDRNLLHTRLLFLNSFLVGKPEYVERVLLGNHQNYVKSRFVRRLLGPTLGQGLVTSDGELWRRQRRIAAPAFHHKRIAGFVDTMAQVATTGVDSWEGKAMPFDVVPAMMALTVEVIARTMFSTDVRGEVERIRRLMDVFIGETKASLLDLFGLPEWLPRWQPRSLRRAIRELDEVVTAFIAPRRADNIDRGDLLSMLLHARDPQTGEGMSDTQLRDEIVTIFSAGHETTANALSWTWYLLARHPDVEAKLHDELRTVLGGRTPTAADLPSLRYTRMVFEESLRLYPPVHSISRMAVGEDWIGGVRVPPGSNITISPWIIHRNPKLWPDPERFDPERFAPEAVAARHRFAFLPFGGGPRICIGMQFAIAEAQVILATIAQRYRLRLDPAHEVVPVGYLTLRARDGIWFKLERRS